MSRVSFYASSQIIFSESGHLTRRLGPRHQTQHTPLPRSHLTQFTVSGIFRHLKAVVSGVAKLRRGHCTQVASELWNSETKSTPVTTGMNPALRPRGLMQSSNKMLISTFPSMRQSVSLSIGQSIRYSRIISVSVQTDGDYKSDSISTTPKPTLSPQTSTQSRSE